MRLQSGFGLGLGFDVATVPICASLPLAEVHMAHELLAISPAAPKGCDGIKSVLHGAEHVAGALHVPSSQVTEVHTIPGEE